MKNIIKLSALAASVALLAGCASYAPQGIIYNGAKVGTAVNNGVPADKTGQACATSVLGLVATGDASIETAKINGGITNVATINYQVNNVLGLYGTYCVIVTGH